MEPSTSRRGGPWGRIVALLLTAAAGWFFGAYVGSMFSAPVEIPASGDDIAGSPSPQGQNVGPRQTPGPNAVAVAPTVAAILPTVAPTVQPTPTPPPGRGASNEGEGFAIQLVDYEIRPAAHPENAAVKYTLRFVNTSPNAIRAEMNLADIKALDTSGATFGDYYAVANQFAESSCGAGAAASKYQMNLTIQIPAQGVKQFDFFLNRAGTEGDCAAQGTGPSRVDASVQFVDIQLGKITYTSDRARELPSSWWRASRT